ncbi:hypothetical protein BN946_scf184746.g31 [Trametes cinnabarina]|uniref:Uncharacterized protein n=1 Tax=Pycnoporus cinnabarinus TaxID=5643 RepID=A0A060S4V0_PYCCI|nr:hypothetical protein BN946_scf184746.g31 [Trametes cinnabarina]
MQAMAVFSNARATCNAMGSSATTPTLFGRFATSATSVYPPWRMTDVAEWDPSRDEIVSTKGSSRWGAVGRKHRARLNFERGPVFKAEQHRTWTQPQAVPHGAPLAQVQVGYGRENRGDEEGQYHATDFLHSVDPNNPMYVAIRAGEEARRAVKANRARRDKQACKEAEEWLTELSNPFNPVNIAAQRAAEAMLEETGVMPDFLAFAASISGWVPAARAVSLADVATAIGTLPVTVKGEVKPRTPSPKPRIVSTHKGTSPGSDCRSDSTNSLWSSLTTVSPAEAMDRQPHHGVQAPTPYLSVNGEAVQKEAAREQLRLAASEELWCALRPAFAGMRFLPVDKD